MDFQLDIFLESFPVLLKGAVLTVELTVISVLLGLVIGLAPWGGFRATGYCAQSPSVTSR